MFTHLESTLVILAARPAVPGQVGWVGTWSPGIGDPTPLGWITVVAYFVAAWLCYRVQRRLHSAPGAFSQLIRRERLLWLAFTVLLVALGINKQLDLQSAMTEFFRQLAHEQGWYENRREYQSAFIEIFFVLGVVGGAALVALTWRMPSAMKIAGLGLCFVGCYVLIRAMSFHNVDALIGRRVLSMRVNWILELGGITVIILGASRRDAIARGVPSRPRIGPKLHRARAEFGAEDLHSRSDKSSGR
jgi:hypothetical protein